MSVRSSSSKADGEGGDRLAGILTRTDLIGRVILPEVPLTAPVSTVMTRDVLSLDADDTAADATLLMAEHSIRHIPVMQREGGGGRCSAWCPSATCSRCIG